MVAVDCNSGVQSDDRSVIEHVPWETVAWVAGAGGESLLAVLSAGVGVNQRDEAEMCPVKSRLELSVGDVWRQIARLYRVQFTS
ncbi:MAG: hypothetical protein ACKV2Q_28570 [Planctomycetaceae bacterium]